MDKKWLDLIMWFIASLIIIFVAAIVAKAEPDNTNASLCCFQIVDQHSFFPSYRL